MICKYCESEATMDNKFYVIDCCVECHKEGRDREEDEEFIDKHKD